MFAEPDPEKNNNQKTREALTDQFPGVPFHHFTTRISEGARFGIRAEKLDL